MPVTSKATILSALWIVDSLWTITIVASSFDISSKEAWIFFSVIEIINSQKQFTLIFSKEEHYRFTSVLIFDDFITLFLLDKIKTKLDEDILNPPSISNLCRTAEMSENKLREFFKNL